LILSLILTSVSSVSFSQIDELRIRDNGGEENFSSFLVTPYKGDGELNFRHALICPEVPGRSVCLSVPHYIQVKDGYEAGKIYKENAVQSEGYDLKDMIIAIGLSLVTGIVIDQTLIRR